MKDTSPLSDIRSANISSRLSFHSSSQCHPGDILILTKTYVSILLFFPVDHDFGIIAKKSANSQATKIFSCFLLEG